VDDCLFCKIAEKKIPSTIVYEDESIIAFEDINPQAPVHVLVIPRKHIPTTLDIRKEDHSVVGQMFQTAYRIAEDRGIAQRGFRLVMNTNQDAGQSVYHIHLHLLGGRRMHWPPG
jgi:histidine triad (HIT) family protein